MLVASPGLVHAHGGDEDGEAEVRAVLDPLPAALAGIHVQLRRTLAPQLLVANTGDRLLVIEDENGRDFLRIGKGRVDGDLGNAAFHRTNTLMAPGAFSADASQAPNWQTVEDSPNWGWFDLRLRTDAVAVPHAVVDKGEKARVSQWSIPVRYGDTESAISGHFEFVPPARGIIEARVTDAGALSASAVVRAMSGSARPGMFVSYRGKEPLVVMGTEGEAFLRFSDAGVDANRASPTWASVRPSGTPEAVAPSDAPQWANLSASATYGWIEPRAAYAGTPPDADEQSVVKRWQIPIQVGDRKGAIQGVTEWQPVTPLAKSGH
ncbi:hypothetical protein [Salinisphaera aquimarina]|uniref:DUF4380 domain-containing protein n=1 Tax=Salinisphaera aquimarina TaxID=2094031 RepID=A0ABV7ESX9_9GAMM